MDTGFLTLVPLPLVLLIMILWAASYFYRNRVVAMLTTRTSRVGFFLSLIALSAFTATFPDLFFFSKEMHLPEWAKQLPAPLKPFHAGRYVSFLLFLPVALLTGFGFNKLGPLLVVAIACPFPAVVIHNNVDFLSGLFNWLFIIVWTLSLPLLAVLTLRFPFDVVAYGKTG